MARKKPIPRSQRKTVQRATQIKRDDTVQDVSVSLMDMDSTIMYYFENVIKPTVIENGETIKVPIMYSSPERWKSIKRDGFMRDKKRQIITPVITYRRTSIERDDMIPQDKLDANNPHLFYTFEKKFSQQNRYDNFTTQVGLLPQREYYNVALPDYVTLTYDFIIWTTYIEQMNKIVERINYSDGAYWGDPNKLRFRSRIDSFTDATEVSDVERLVRTNFTVTLRGYLLPEGNFDHRSTTQKFLTPKRVVFGTETDAVVDRVTGLPGQFLEGLEDTIGGVASPTSAEAIGITLSFPLVLQQSTGVTLSNNNAEFDGGSRLEQIISIGQAVATTDNVTFAQVSGSSLVLDSTVYDGGSITGDINITGSVTSTGTFTVNGNATIDGIVTAQEFHSEFVSASIIFSSGSTKFGDTLDDTHHFTGSLLVTGSLALNSYTVTEFSNDTSLADSSANALVTEYAVKNYVDDNSTDQQTYLRKQYFKTTTAITVPATASFTAVTASAPSGMTGTTKNDFIFFINGQYMEHDALAIQQSGSYFYLKVNSDSIGYDLESDDEVLVIGKFNS